MNSQKEKGISNYQLALAMFKPLSFVLILAIVISNHYGYLSTLGEIEKAEAAYTINDSDGYFQVDFNGSPQGIAPAGPLRDGINIDGVAGNAQLVTGSSTGFFTTIEVTPNSFSVWKEFKIDGNYSATSDVQARILDCSTSPVPVAGALGSYQNFVGGKLDISSLSTSTYSCIRAQVKLTKSGAISPDINDFKITWSPLPVLLTAHTINSTTSPVGAVINYQIKYSVSYSRDNGVVAWVPIPNNTTNPGSIVYPAAYPATSSATSSTSSYTQDATPVFVSADNGGLFTSTAITVNGTNIPANSVYWNLGVQQAGTTGNLGFKIQSPDGTQNGVQYITQSHIDSVQALEKTSDSNKVIAGAQPLVVTLTSAAGPTINKHIIIDNAYKIGGEWRIVNTAPVITYHVGYGNFANIYNIPLSTVTGTGEEAMFNTILTDDVTDILGKMQSASCGSLSLGAAQARISAISSGGTLSGNAITWSIGNLAVGSTTDTSFAVDYAGCIDNTSINNIASIKADNTATVTDQVAVKIGIDLAPTGIFAKGDTIYGKTCINYGKDDNQCDPANVPVLQMWGEDGEYNMIATNNGASRIDDIYIFDKIPEGQTFVSAGSADPSVKVFYNTDGALNATDTPPTYSTSTMPGSLGGTWTDTVPATATDVVWVAYYSPSIASAVFPTDPGSAYASATSFFIANLNTNIIASSTADQCSVYEQSNTAVFEAYKVSNALTNADANMIDMTTKISALDTELTHVSNKKVGKLEISTSDISLASTTVEAPGTQSITITIRNTGQDASLNTLVTFPIPTANINGVVQPVDFVSASGGTVTAIGGPVTSVEVNVGTVNAGSQKSVTLNISIPSGISNGDVVTGNVVVTGNDDASCEDLKATKGYDFDIHSVPNVQIYKTRDESVIPSKGDIHYQIHYNNLGSAPTHNQYIIDRIPVNTVFKYAYTGGTDDNNNGYDCGGCKAYFSTSLPALPAGVTPMEVFDLSYITSNFTLGTEVSSGKWTSPFGSGTLWVAFLSDDTGIASPNFSTTRIGDVGITVANDLDGAGPGTAGSPAGDVIANESAVFADEVLQAISNQVLTTILPDAGLLVDKYSSTDYVSAGETFDWYINYRNDTGNDTDYATITDTLPAGVSLVGVYNTWSNFTASSSTSTPPSGEQNITANPCVSTTINPDYTTSVVVNIAGCLRGNVLFKNEGGRLRISAQASSTLLTGAVLLNKADGLYQNASSGPFLIRDEDPVFVVNPDLWMRKQVNIQEPVAGETLDYTLTVSNEGKHFASGTIVTDTLPIGLCYVGGSTTIAPSGYSLGEPTVTGGPCASAPTTLTWNNIQYTGLPVGRIPALSPDIYIRYKVQVDSGVAAGTTLINGAGVTNTLPEDPVYSNGDTKSVTVPYPDVYVTKSAQATVEGGGTFEYTITYGNASRQAAANVYIVDTLPDTDTNGDSDVTLVSVNATGTKYYNSAVGAAPAFNPLSPVSNGWGITPATSTNHIAVLYGNMTGNDGPYTVRIKVTARDPGTNIKLSAGTKIVNNVIASTTDFEATTTNNMSAATTTIPAFDLTISKTGSAEGAYPGLTPGAPLSYTVVLQNKSTQAACSVYFTDTLPVGYDYTSISPMNATLKDELGNNTKFETPLGTPINSAVPLVITSSGSTYRYELGSPYANVCMPANTSATFTINGKVNSAVLDGTTLSNTVHIGEDSVGVEDTTSNNDATSTVVVWRADVITTKDGKSCGADQICGNGDDSPTNANIGDLIRYTIGYNNIGNANASNTILEEVVPVGTCFKTGSISNIPGIRAIEYSSDGGSTWTYKSTVASGACDASITNFRVIWTTLPAPATFTSESPVTGYNGNFSSSSEIAMNYKEVGLDIDGNGVVDTSTDGILLVRYFLKYKHNDPLWTGTNITTGVVGLNATRTTEPQVVDFIENNLYYYDVDRSGDSNASDGMYIVRNLLGISCSGVAAGGGIISGSSGLVVATSSIPCANLVANIDAFPFNATTTAGVALKSINSIVPVGIKTTSGVYVRDGVFIMDGEGATTNGYPYYCEENICTKLSSLKYRSGSTYVVSSSTYVLPTGISTGFQPLYCTDSSCAALPVNTTATVSYFASRAGTTNSNYVLFDNGTGGTQYAYYCSASSCIEVASSTSGFNVIQKSVQSAEYVLYSADASYDCASSSCTLTSTNPGNQGWGGFIDPNTGSYVLKPNGQVPLYCTAGSGCVTTNAPSGYYDAFNSVVIDYGTPDAYFLFKTTGDLYQCLGTSCSLVSGYTGGTVQVLSTTSPYTYINFSVFNNGIGNNYCSGTSCSPIVPSDQDYTITKINEPTVGSVNYTLAKTTGTTSSVYYCTNASCAAVTSAGLYSIRVMSGGSGEYLVLPQSGSGSAYYCTGASCVLTMSSPSGSIVSFQNPNSTTYIMYSSSAGAPIMYCVQSSCTILPSSSSGIALFVRSLTNGQADFSNFAYKSGSNIYYCQTTSCSLVNSQASVSTNVLFPRNNPAGEYYILNPNGKTSRFCTGTSCVAIDIALLNYSYTGQNTYDYGFAIFNNSNAAPTSSPIYYCNKSNCQKIINTTGRRVAASKSPIVSLGHYIIRNFTGSVTNQSVYYCKEEKCVSYMHYGNYSTVLPTSPNNLGWNKLLLDFNAPPLTSNMFTVCSNGAAPLSEGVCSTPGALLYYGDASSRYVDISSISSNVGVAVRVDMYTSDYNETPLIKTLIASYYGEAPSFTWDAIVISTASPRSSIDNVVTIQTDTPEITTANNTDNKTLQLNLSDLEITKTVNKGSAINGDTLSYSLKYKNNGPATAQGVSITDILPAGVAYVSAVPTTSGVSCSLSAQTITCTKPNWSMTVNEEGEVIVSVNVATSTADLTLINNTTISASTTDPTPANNVSSAYTVIGNYANNYIRKSGPTRANVDKDITYTIEYGNNGAAASANDQIIDTYNPAQMTFVSATSTGGISCGVSVAGTVECDNNGAVAGGQFSLVAGATGTISVTMHVVNDFNLLVTNALITNHVDINTSSTESTVIDNADDHDVPVWPIGYSSLSGYVFVDHNSDVAKNGADTSIVGVEMSLTGTDIYGHIITATTTTDSDGFYSFHSLSPGTYVVTETQPAQYVSTGSKGGYVPLVGATSTGSVQGGPNPNRVSNIVLGEAQNSVQNNFGELAGEIGNQVWIDTDGDGVFNNGEVGLAGVPVYAYLDANTNGLVDIGETAQLLYTNASGTYLFTDLPIANYIVVVDTLSPAILVPGYVPTTLGIPNTNNNNQNSSGYLITLTAGVPTNYTADFGFKLPIASIGNTIWYDTNANGYQDIGEQGMANITLELYDATGTLINSTTTNSAGNYLFEGLAASATYTVKVATSSLPVWINADTSPYSASSTGDGYAKSPVGYTVYLSSSNLTADFGYVTLGSLGDTVWFDRNLDGHRDSTTTEPGLQSVQVNLYNASNTLIATTTTDSNGNYMFTNLPVNFTYTVSVATNTLPVWAYIVTGTATSTDNSTNDYGHGVAATATLSTSTIQNLNLDFGFSATGTVGNQLFIDNNLNGTYNSGIDSNISNWLVSLFVDADNNGLLSTSTGDYLYATTTTNASGNYSFTDLPLVSYIVRVTNSITGYFSQIFGTNVGSDNNAQSNDYAISLATSTPSNTTADFGYYIMPDLSIVKTAATSSPIYINSTTSFSIVVSVNKDFGAASNTITVSDTLPSGLSYVSAVGTNWTCNSTILCTYTGAYPVIASTTLPTITVVAQAVATGTYTNTAIVDMASTTDMHEATTTNNTSSAGVEIWPEGQIGNQVFFDQNNDGVYNGVDFGLANVTIELRNASNTLIATTTTDSNGNYIFHNVALNQNYTVNVLGSTVPSWINNSTHIVAGVTTTDSYAKDTTGYTVYISTTTPTNYTADFGYTALGSIGDTVFFDQNNDGVFNGVDTLLSNVLVILKDNLGITIGTASTSATGTYQFNNLMLNTASGTYYTVTVATSTLPTGLNLNTLGTANTNNNSQVNGSQYVLSTSTQNIAYADFGFTARGEIGNHVFFDRNNDGLYSGTTTEQALANVQVDLYNASNTLIATTTTDSNGNYMFTNLDVDATYTVKVATSTLPAWATTSTGQISTIDESAKIDTGYDVYLSAATNTNYTADFGYTTLGSIGNQVFLDTNHDGLYSTTTESGISGVVIELYNAITNALVGTTTTNGAGTYSFTDLPLISYVVKVLTSTLPAWATNWFAGLTTIDYNSQDYTGYTVNLSTSTPVNTTADFGFADSYDLGITKTDNKSTYLSDTATRTNVYTIVVTNYSLATVTNATVTDSIPAGIASQSWSCAAAAGDSCSVISGVGNVSTLVSLAAGHSATITATATVQAGYIDPIVNVASVILPSNYFQSTTTNNADAATDTDTVALASVGDRVWSDDNNNGVQDAGELGVANVVVTLYSSSSAIVATTTTSATGTYLFDNLIPGTYSIGFSSLPATTTLSTQNVGASTTIDSDASVLTGFTPSFTLVSDEHNMSIDAGIVTLGSLGDTVWFDRNLDGHRDSTTTEPGLQSVQVNLYNASNTLIATTTTDSNGNYMFTNLPVNFTYTVSVATNTLPVWAYIATVGTMASANDYSHNPSYDITLTSVARENYTGDFGFSATGTVGNQLYFDLDANGKFDAGETTPTGATVGLYNTAGTLVSTTTTDASGNYLFKDLPLINYIVKVIAGVAGSAYFPISTTTDNYGKDPAGYPVSISTSTPSDYTADFGYLQGKIGNRVYIDENRDGQYTASDTPIAGVTIELYNPSGVLIATTTTSATGTYLFENLPPMAYTLKVLKSTVPNPDYSGIVSGLMADDQGKNPTGYIVTLTPSYVEDYTADFGFNTILSGSWGGYSTSSGSGTSSPVIPVVIVTPTSTTPVLPVTSTSSAASTTPSSPSTTPTAIGNAVKKLKKRLAKTGADSSTAFIAGGVLIVLLASVYLATKGKRGRSNSDK